MKTTRRFLAILILAGVALPLSVSPAQEVPRPLDTEYRFVVGDQIQIAVDGHPDLDKSFTIPVEGDVSFPPIGRIRLLAASRVELEDLIVERLKEKEQFRSPRVFVMLQAYAPRRAYLWGAVSQAIDLSPHRQYSLIQVLSIAGADPQTADFKNIRIIRKKPDGSSFMIPVNLEDVFSKQRFDNNLLVMPEDIIQVPSFQNLNQTAWVYVLGKINKPGRYGFLSEREPMSLLRVLSMAGDLHQFADENSILILRRGRNKTVPLEVDFDDIISGKIEDPELQADDIIYVPESFL